MPAVSWTPVLAGSTISIVIALAGLPLIGVIAGGAIAGRLASQAAAYHGSLVAVVTILTLALLPVPGPAETLLILITDAVLLAAATLAAVAAARLRPRER